MDFGEMFRVLLRRWFISAPGVLLTALVAASSWAQWPTTYQSEAQITLIGSQTLASGPGGGHNPYVAVGDLVPMASILATTLSSEEASQRLRMLGVTEPYSVDVPPGAAGPFIAITVTGKDQATILRSVPVIINFAGQELRQLQHTAYAAISVKSLIGLEVIAEPSSPAPVLKSKIEVVAGMTIACLVVVLLVSFAVEGRTNRRATKRRMNAENSSARRHRSSSRRNWPEDAREPTPSR
jgi:hypothetical protein